MSNVNNNVNINDNVNINKIIQSAISNAVSNTISELKKNNLINKQTPFQKTEILLYNYMSFKEVIEDKYRQIETIQEEGVPKKSNSITSFSNESMTYVKSEFEKAEELISSIENSVRVTSKFINIIDCALNSLKGDMYYEIIPMKYFEGLTREDIAEQLNCDVRTVSRNKNRLINKLQIKLFSDEFLFQILE